MIYDEYFYSETIYKERNHLKNKKIKYLAISFKIILFDQLHKKNLLIEQDLRSYNRYSIYKILCKYDYLLQNRRKHSKNFYDKHFKKKDANKL